MVSILDADGIAGQLADSLRAFDLPQAGVLRQTTTTGRDEFGDPIVTTTDTTVECWREGYDAEWLAAGIASTDVRIVVLSNGLTVTPAQGDKIKLADDSWFSIREVTIDPAGAAYACDSFGIEAPDA